MDSKTTKHNSNYYTKVPRVPAAFITVSESSDESIAVKSLKNDNSL